MSQTAGPSTADLYHLLGRQLHGTALRMLRSLEEAEDVVQDAFLNYHRQGREMENSGGWLHRVVVNGCLDRLRSRSRWRETEFLETDSQLGAPGAAAPHGVPSVAQRIDLERAVATLPEAARVVFLLHDVEGFRHREVGDMLGISEGTSKSQLFRAREILRAFLLPAPAAIPAGAAGAAVDAAENPGANRTIRRTNA